jgi:Ca2+-binding RTX toxin-like protein
MGAFSGSPGDDIYTGGIDNDTATGAGGNDSLSGADGADRLAGGSGADTLDGGAGDDTIFSGDASPAYNLPYYGNSYVLPALDTGAEVDTLRGGDGSDRIFAGYGDNVDGGADGSFGDYLFISFQGAPAGVTADFSLATQTIGGGVITGVENISYVQGSQYGDNIDVQSVGNNGYSDFTVVSGMDGSDTLTAGYYTGTMFGDAGDDVVDGRGSQYLQLVDGGAGNDTLYTNANTFAQASGGAGNDTIYAHGLTHGDAGDDVIVMQWTYYSGQVYGDDGDDKVTAAETGNRIAGGSGADTLIGGNGADSLYSADFAANGSAAADDMGLEHDRLSGGGGADDLAIGYGDDADGGGGTDTLRLSLGGLTHGIDFDTAGIVSGAPVTLGGGVIQNVETLLSLRGSDFADTLRLATQATQLTVDAGAGDDVIISQGSSVSVLGGAGNDRFVSGVAGDVFDGGSGVDTVDYSAATSAVTVNLKTGSGAGGDTFVHVEGIIGSAFNDTLVGAANGSSLSGGAGADRLEVGFGDVASLGAGADLVFVSPGSHSASVQGGVVTVTDWGAADALQFGASTGAYAETTAASFAGAVQAAEQQEAAGYNFVAVQVGADVYVFGDAVSQRLHFDDAVRLVGTDLSTESASNVGLPGAPEPPLAPPAPPPPTPPPSTPPPSQPPPAPPPSTPAPGEPALPAAPSAGFGGASGAVVGDMDHAHLSYVLNAVITDGSDTFVTASLGDIALHLTGYGFALDAAGHLAGGVATSIAYSYGAAHGGPFSISAVTPQVPLTTLAAWALSDDVTDFFNAVLSGGDRLGGGAGADLLHGYGGNDLLYGAGGSDVLWGGPGNDVIYAQAPPGLPTGAAGSTYLRGEDGDDYIVGGDGFDDANGNMGNDTISTGAGDDWSVGGKDNDLLFGDAGSDVVWGNLGNDTCVGGDGNDQVRGGQANDVIFGGAGDDYVSGDRGDDTVSGGSGADLFHTFSDAGVDRVLDFHLGEGDRVMLDPGTAYTVSQVGADTVIDMTGGAQMILVGVQMSTLTPGWIFGA